MRTAIYTTNTVEAVHRQFRKLTKTKGGFRMKQFAQIIICQYVERLGALDAPHTKLEFDVIAIVDSFCRRLDAHINL